MLEFARKELVFTSSWIWKAPGLLLSSTNTNSIRTQEQNSGFFGPSVGHEPNETSASLLCVVPGFDLRSQVGSVGCSYGTPPPQNVPWEMNAFSFRESTPLSVRSKEFSRCYTFRRISDQFKIKL